MMRWKRLGLISAMTATLAACAGIPGVSGVGYKADSPDMAWNESKFKQVYGEPKWSHTLPDGRRLAYFEYNNAFDDRTNRLISAAAFVMTMGLDSQIENATDRRLSAIFNADGSAICADREPGELLMACDNEVRAEFVSARDTSPARDYWHMMVDIEPKVFAPATFVVEPYHRNLLGDPAAVLGDVPDGISRDDEYFSDLYCYAAAHWYRGHITEFRLENDPPGDAALMQLERQALQQIARRGRLLDRIDRDMALAYATLQYDLDGRRLWRARSLAERCLNPDGQESLKAEIHPVVIDALYARLAESKRLAQAAAVRDFELPETTPAAFELLEHPPHSGRIGNSNTNWVVGDSLEVLGFNSEPWLALLTESIEAQRLRINTMDALTADATYEYEIRKALDQGLEPSLDIALSLASVLSDAIVRNDHEDAVRALVALARFHMAGEPRAFRYQRAGDLLMAASFIAHRMGRFDWSVPIARTAGDAYILAADNVLAEDGLGTRQDRDQLREIINFVPYSYDYTDVSGNVWRVDVQGPPLDPERMLQLISRMRVPYVNASQMYAYARPRMSSAVSAAQEFESLAARANETFSSAGAYAFYRHAASSAQVFDEARGHINQMNAEFARYRTSSTTTTGRKVACEQYYTEAREAFANYFGNPSYRQVEDLYGKGFRDDLKDYDKKCKYKP